MDCIFCKIVKGELPSYTVYEDSLFLGFLDIYPQSRGKVLLIPKHHYRWVNDVPEFGVYWETARTIALSLEKNLSATSISYLTFGEEVPHAHIHIVPIYAKSNPYLSLNKSESYTKEEMKKIQKLLTS